MGSGETRVLLALGAAVLLCLSTPRDAIAQGDGARNYQLVPDGTRSVSAFANYVHGNQSADPSTVVPGARLDTYLGVLQYVQAFALAGNQVSVFGVLPFGRVTGSVNLPGGTVSTSSSGLGDATLGAMVGLIGAPALSAKEYAEYRPGFTLGALGKISMPTGDYDASRPINLGANRWTLQLGAPLVQYLGSSLLDPALLSVELTPSVSFFSTNNEPHNANTVKQRPLAKLEGHITRNFGPSFWVSADLVSGAGGATSTDGGGYGIAQHWLNLGVTAGMAFSDTVSGGINYGKVVRSNTDGLEVRGVRAYATFAF